MKVHGMNEAFPCLYEITLSCRSYTGAYVLTQRPSFNVVFPIHLPHPSGCACPVRRLGVHLTIAMAKSPLHAEDRVATPGFAYEKHTKR
jgi:hypothetical protein